MLGMWNSTFLFSAWETTSGRRKPTSLLVPLTLLIINTRVEYVKGGAAPLFLMGQVFEVFFEVFSLFCRIIMDYVRTQIRASF